MKYRGIGDFTNAGLLILPTYATTGALPTAAAGNRGSLAFIQADNGAYLSNGSAWGILGSKWTDAGSFTYLTATGDRLVIGSATELNTSYALQVSGNIYGNELRTNTSYITHASGARTFQKVGTNFFLAEAGNATASGGSNTALGYQAGLALTSSNNNTFFGYQAGTAITSSSDNTAIGYLALSTLVSGTIRATAIGTEALRYATGANNVAIGYRAGQGTSGSATGVSNTFIGYQAGNVFSTGDSNTYIGANAGSSSTTGTSNVFIGANAGLLNVDGQNACNIGPYAGRTNTSGFGNTNIGYRAGYYAVNANNAVGYNVFIGVGAGEGQTGNVSTGTFITAIGSNAGAYFSTNTRSTYVGYYAGGEAGTGNDQVAIGSFALLDNNGNNNVGIGSSALRGVFAGSFGGNNVGIGYSAGNAITSGNANTFIGYQSALNLTTGADNVFIGTNSALAVTTASFQFSAGTQSLRYSNGDYNIALGYLAGRGASGGASGTSCIWIGQETGQSWTTGIENVVIGIQAGNAVTTGNKNIYLGARAGVTSTTGSGNIIIGSDASGLNNSSASVSNELRIASLIYGTTINTFASGLLGIGVVAPAAKLHVLGIGATSSTWDLQVHNSSGSNNALMVRSDGRVGFGTAAPSSMIDCMANGLGTTQNDAAGAAMTNTTAAAAGAQQISPAVRWTGQGWKTDATAASRAVDFRAYVIPVQGTANPSVTWIMEYQVNGGGYFGIMSMNSKEQVGIGVQNPDVSAVLEVKSTTMGLLVPRMNTSQKNAVNTPANGLMLYDTDLAKFQFRQGGAWSTMGAGTILGTISTTQIAFGTAADTIGGNAAFVWDNTNSRLGVNKTGPTRTLHIGGPMYAEGGIMESSGTGNVISVNTAAGIRLHNTTGGTGITWGIGSNNSGDLDFHPDHATPIFSLSSANWGARVGGDSNCYLWGMFTVSGGKFTSADCQSSTLTGRNDITGTAATEIWLDGSAVRAILSGNRVWTGVIYIHARIKTQGNGSLIANTFYSHAYKFSIERNGATTTLLGQEAIGTAFFTVGFAPTISITADDTNESLKITYAVGAGGGSTTVSRVSATIHFNDVQF